MSLPQTPRRIKRGWVPYRVARRVEETHDTVTLYLEDAQEGSVQVDYTAGQYITFKFDHLAEKPIVRSYTLSSSPHQKEHILVTVKKVPFGLVSHFLCDQVKEGDILHGRGPMGTFVFKPVQHHPQTTILMVAAGSGVTPFLSIGRSLLEAPHEGAENVKVIIAVGYRTTQDLIGWQELTEWQKKHPNRFELFVALSREKHQEFLHGRIDQKILQNLVGSKLKEIHEFTHVMTCGPKDFMAEVKAFSESLGLEPGRFMMESFD